MTGLQFSELATRSGRSHSLLSSITWEAIRNSLKLQEFSFPDFIYIRVCVCISSYLKPLDYPQVPIPEKTNTTFTSSVPSLQSETSLTAYIPCVLFGKITSGPHQSWRNTEDQISISFKKAHVKRWHVTTSGSCRTRQVSCWWMKVGHDSSHLWISQPLKGLKLRKKRHCGS